MHMVVSSGEGEISPQSLVAQYIFLFQNFMLVDNFFPLFFCVCVVFFIGSVLGSPPEIITQDVLQKCDRFNEPHYKGFIRCFALG